MRVIVRAMRVVVRAMRVIVRAMRVIVRAMRAMRVKQKIKKNYKRKNKEKK